MLTIQQIQAAIQAKLNGGANTMNNQATLSHPCIPTANAQSPNNSFFAKAKEKVASGLETVKGLTPVTTRRFNAVISELDDRSIANRILIERINAHIGLPPMSDEELAQAVERYKEEVRKEQEQAAQAQAQAAIAQQMMAGQMDLAAMIQQQIQMAIAQQMQQAAPQPQPQVDIAALVQQQVQAAVAQQMQAMMASMMPQVAPPQVEEPSVEPQEASPEVSNEGGTNDTPQQPNASVAPSSASTGQPQQGGGRRKRLVPQKAEFDMDVQM